MSVLLAFTAAMLFGIGTYLVLQRKLSRVIIGLGLLTHGANVLMLTAGDRGHAPLIGSGESGSFADPLPQALALTAIVISFGVTALLLALAYRSWLLSDDDDIRDVASSDAGPEAAIAAAEVAEAEESSERGGSAVDAESAEIIEPGPGTEEARS